jgi:tetratricopeptide (TPR) repeat protein
MVSSQPTIKRGILNDKEGRLRYKISASWLISTIPKGLEEICPFDIEKIAKEARVSKFSTLQECIAYCNAAIKENPNGAYQHYMKGRCLIHLERNTEALNSFNAALKLDPGEADYYLEIARVKMFQGDLDNAKAYAEMAEKINPNCSIELVSFVFPKLMHHTEERPLVIKPKLLIRQIEKKKIQHNPNSISSKLRRIRLFFT